MLRFRQVKQNDNWTLFIKHRLVQYEGSVHRIVDCSDWQQLQSVCSQGLVVKSRESAAEKGQWATQQTEVCMCAV